MSRPAPARWRAAPVVLVLMTLRSLVAAEEPPGRRGVLWEDFLDPAGGFDSVFHVAVRGSRVFAAGTVTPAERQGAFLVRAYDARTGERRWEDVDDRGEANDFAYGVAATEEAVFAVGFVRDPHDADWLVRSYDPDTGALRWEDQLDHAGGNDFALDLVTDGRRVYVSGTALSPTVDPRFAFNFDWRLRAYDGANGSLLWEAETDLVGGNDQSGDVSVGPGRVLQVGGIQTDAGHRDFVVRAYDTETGTLVWSDQLDGARGDDFALSVAVQGRRALAAGAVGADFAVRAYDLDHGDLLWEDRLDLGGGLDRAVEVAVHGRRAFAVGFGTNDSGNLDLLVRTYDLRTGELLWSDQVDGAGGDDAAAGLAVGAGQAFVAGQTSVDATCMYFVSGNCAWTVRAYEASTGRLSWEERRPTAGGNDFAATVAAHGGRVLVGGRVSDPPGDGDFLLRAYPARAASESENPQPEEEPHVRK